MLISKANFGVIILAAGFSKRMGKPKASLQWLDGQLFWQKIVSEYKNWGCTEIILVVNELFCFDENEIPNDVKIVVNLHPELGRIYSIQLGIAALESKNYCFIQNVDNPTISSQILEAIYEKSTLDSYVSPKFKGKGGHPIILGRKLMLDLLENKYQNSTLQDFLMIFPKIEVDVLFSEILININTPLDMENLTKNFHFENEKDCINLADF